MWKLLNKFSYIIGFVGSFLVIYENHLQVRYGKYNWIWLVGAGFLGIHLIKKLKKYCKEIAYIQKGKLSVETPRRPFAYIMYDLGGIGVTAWILYKFFNYIENTTQDLSNTFYLIFVCFMIALGVGMFATFMEEKKG